MVRFASRRFVFVPSFDITVFLARLVVGDSESAPGSACSQATIDGGRVSNFKIMAVRRGFSSEGDLLLDYLEKGVFHALEKQYLKSFVLALYLVRGRSRFRVLPPLHLSRHWIDYSYRTGRTRIISSKRTHSRFITTSSQIRPSGFLCFP